MNRRVEKSDYYVTCDNYNYNVEKTASRDLYKRMEELKILESEILRNQKY